MSGEKQIVLSASSLIYAALMLAALASAAYILYQSAAQPITYIGSYPAAADRVVDTPFRATTYIYVVDASTGKRSLVAAHGILGAASYSGVDDAGDVYVDIYSEGPDAYSAGLAIISLLALTAWIHRARRRLLERQVLLRLAVLAAVYAVALASISIYVSAYSVTRVSVYGMRKPAELNVTAVSTGAFRLGILDPDIRYPSIIMVKSKTPFSVIIAYYEEINGSYVLRDSENLTSLTTYYTGYIEPLGRPERGRNVLVLAMPADSIIVEYRKVYFVEENPEPQPLIKLAPSITTASLVALAAFTSLKEQRSSPRRAMAGGGGEPAAEPAGIEGVSGQNSRVNQY